jgi:hypothetical protein
VGCVFERSNKCALLAFSVAQFFAFALKHVPHRGVHFAARRFYRAARRVFFRVESRDQQVCGMCDNFLLQKRRDACRRLLLIRNPGKKATRLR